MNKIRALILSSLFLAGCGVSQKQLREMDSLLSQAQVADCTTVKQYLAVVQTEIQKKIK